MFEYIPRLVGFISVKETPTHIIINGMPGLRFSADIYQYWKTSRISVNMFTVLNRNQVKFSKFFAVEVAFMLQTLIDSRRTNTPKRTLIKVLNLLEENTWLAHTINPPTTSKLNMSRLKRLNVSPLKHQSEFLQAYDHDTQRYSLKGYLMDAATGAGKTLNSIFLGLALEADTIIILCPKNAVLDVWKKTLDKNFHETPSYWHSLSGTAPTPGKEFYILHYEYLENFLLFVKDNPSGFGKIYLALDESHNFTEMTSQRTLRFIELCLILKIQDLTHNSGTPLKAMGSEAIPLLLTIDSFFDQDSVERFKKIFGKDPKRAIEILAHRMGRVSHKVVKADIETPGVDFHEIRVPIKNGQEYTLDAVREKMSKFIEQRMKFYNDNMKEYWETYNESLAIHKNTLNSGKEKNDFDRYNGYVTLLRKGYDPITMKDVVVYCNQYELKKIVPTLPRELKTAFLHVRAIIKYVELKVMGEALSQVLGRMRIQCHLDMLPFMPITDIIDNSKKKTVIFTSYVEVVKELAPMLAKSGYKPEVVYGDTNKNLNQIIKRFFDDPDVNPLIATFKSLSTAVPLIAANTEIFTNAPFREYERTQTVGRVDRLGQDTRCHVYDIYLDTGEAPNISTRSKDIMQWSKNAVESILGVQSSDTLDIALESMILMPYDMDVLAESFIAGIHREYPPDIYQGISGCIKGDPSLESLNDFIPAIFRKKKPTQDLENQKYQDKWSM